MNLYLRGNTLTIYTDGQDEELNIRVIKMVKNRKIPDEVINEFKVNVIPQECDICGKPATFFGDIVRKYAHCEKLCYTCMCVNIEGFEKV